MDRHFSARLDDFVRDENIRNYEHQLTAEIEPTRCATLLRLLVEEENKLGWSREQLAIAEHRIADANRRIDSQIAIIDRLTNEGEDANAAKALLVTLRQTLALYRAYHARIVDNLNGRTGTMVQNEEPSPEPPTS